MDNDNKRIKIPAETYSSFPQYLGNVVGGNLLVNPNNATGASIVNRSLLNVSQNPRLLDEISNYLSQIGLPNVRGLEVGSFSLILTTTRRQFLSMSFDPSHHNRVISDLVLQPLIEPKEFAAANEEGESCVVKVEILPQIPDINDAIQKGVIKPKDALAKFYNFMDRARGQGLSVVDYRVKYTSNPEPDGSCEIREWRNMYPNPDDTRGVKPSVRGFNGSLIISNIGILPNGDLVTYDADMLRGPNPYPKGTIFPEQERLVKLLGLEYGKISGIYSQEEIHSEREQWEKSRRAMGLNADNPSAWSEVVGGKNGLYKEQVTLAASTVGRQTDLKIPKAVKDAVGEENFGFCHRLRQIKSATMEKAKESPVVRGC